jgi:hypothetical protein
MKLDKSPFVIISVVGQELLGVAQYAAAVIVLEAALRIGTCSLKLRGSVFSALSSAYWALNSLDKVHRSLGREAAGCCHGKYEAVRFRFHSVLVSITGFNSWQSKTFLFATVSRLALGPTSFP